MLAFGLQASYFRKLLFPKPIIGHIIELSVGYCDSNHELFIRIIDRVFDKKIFEAVRVISNRLIILTEFTCCEFVLGKNQDYFPENLYGFFSESLKCKQIRQKIKKTELIGNSRMAVLQ